MGAFSKHLCPFVRACFVCRDRRNNVSSADRLFPSLPVLAARCGGRSRRWLSALSARYGGHARGPRRGYLLGPRRDARTYDYLRSDFAHLAACLELPYTCSLLIKSTAGSSGRHVEQEIALRRRVDTTNPLHSKSGLGQRDVTTYQIRSETTRHHAVLSIVTGRQRCERRLADKWWADRETSGHKESGVTAASRHDRA